MDDLVVRVVLVVVTLAIAGAVALTFRRRAFHAPIDISGAGFEPGLVVFTSTECIRCKVVLAAAKETGAPLREVTYELESALQERLGVTGVPLTVVVAEDGKSVAQFAGVVGERQLRRALARAGV